MYKKDLTGSRFGKLTVLGDSGQRKNKSILWRCLCDCGGEVLAITSHLTGGAVTNCGCIPRKRTVFGGAEDLTGRRFGELTVLSRAENSPGNRTRWLCRCSCGNQRIVASNSLKDGTTQSCGCKRRKTFGGNDLTGRRFGRAVALYPLQEEHKGSSVIWHCRCDCGKEFDTAAYCLTNGSTRSCGCLTREVGERLHTYLHLTEDTCVEGLVRAQKNFRNNTSGFRGVWQTPRGTYRVTINFQKKLYYLGTYKSYEEAVQTRREAEQSLHAGFVQAYHKWEERARKEPEWAENNVFFYHVVQSRGDFQVSTNGI